MKKHYLLFAIILFITNLEAREVSIEEKIASLYISFFNRAPDQAGLSYWTNQANIAELNGESSLNVLKQLSQGFATHPTFTSTYNSMSDEAFVQAIYQNSLGREGDIQGVTYWKGLLFNGKSRSDMVAEFMELSLTLDLTPENFPTLSQEELNGAIERQTLISNKAEVAVYFTNTLGIRTNLNSSTNAMDPNSLVNDSAYLASQRVIADVGLNSESVLESKVKLEALENDTDAIDKVIASWETLNSALPSMETPPIAPEVTSFTNTEISTPPSVPSI